MINQLTYQANAARLEDLKRYGIEQQRTRGLAATASTSKRGRRFPAPVARIAATRTLLRLPMRLARRGNLG